MDSPSSPRLIPTRPPWVVLLALALGVAGYGWFIYHYGAPYAGGTDSSGYLNSARLITHGQLSEPVRTVPGLAPPEWSYFFYQPLGCNVNPATGILVPSYPIGLPIHFAAAALFVGLEKAARAINVLNVLAAGGLLYALGRQLGLARSWSLAGVAVLWACPVWIYQSLQPMSDCVATTWAIAAILAALRARHRPAWALAAGAAFAVGVLVRPTNAVLLVPLAIALGKNSRGWRWFALGGLPFALGLGAYNGAVYGSFIASGYIQGGENILGAFEWRFLDGNLRHFAIWITLLLGAPVVLLAVFGLPWTLRRTPAIGLLLVSWLAAFVALYACYFCAGETWWYLRFLLPAFPAIILAGLLALQGISSRCPGHVAWLAPTAVLVGSISWQYHLVNSLNVIDIRAGERNYWLAGTWLRTHVPADTILLAWHLSGSLLFYTHQPIVRWDQIGRSDFDRLRRTAAALHRPIYAPLFAFEKVELQRKLGGQWVAIEHPGNVTIWRLIEEVAPTLSAPSP